MELTQLQKLLPSFEELKKAIESEKAPIDKQAIANQYDPARHDIMDNTKRPDKIVQTETGISTVAVTRLPVPFQKRIVNMAATFLCGNPIQLVASPDEGIESDLFDVVKKTWDDNKLDYESKALAGIMMSETEVAELWYTEPVDPLYWSNTPNEGAKFKLRMKILAGKFGDQLYPVYNMVGDMVAFGRAYSIKVGDRNEEHFDVYTDTATYKGVKGEAGWQVVTEGNVVGKIPVIYYKQEQPEWRDVQWLIDRFEKSISNHGDTNDYFGSPMVKVKGEVKGFAKKGEQGKVLELSNGAEAEYMSWDNSPESVKLEQQNLRSLIHDLSDTPDISFESVKGLGTYSGVALKMIFLGAHMKAANKEEVFGKGIQRRINYLKAALAKINVRLEAALSLTIKPKFEYYLPKNFQEITDTLVTATGGKPIMSRRTAVALNPLIEDPEKELQNLEDEDDSAAIGDREFDE